MKLFAPESYWTLSPAGRAELNGCGPGGWQGKLIPDHILWVSITPACDIHDYMYAVGQTEDDRAEADRVFLNNILRIVEDQSANWATRFVRRRLALHYYAAVRDFGAIFFWDDKNSPETFRELATDMVVQFRQGGEAAH